MAKGTLATLLAGFATAVTARHCQNLTVPISISSQNGNFTMQAPSTNIQVTDFILDFSRPGTNYSASVLSGANSNSSSNSSASASATAFATVSGTYAIAATYCEPDAGPGHVLQVLTHGIGFDRSYWDLSAHAYNYSYAAAATARGYSTFAFDRLGIAESFQPGADPVNDIQAWLEIAALKQLTASLRDAQVPGIAARFDKIVHVGHSFGSIQTYGLTAADPGASDGIALTGFSQRSEFVPYFELGGDFVMANGVPSLVTYPHGYLASGSISAVQTNFFAPGQFDPDILDVAYTTGKPVTVGELLTLGAPASAVNPFEGPVLVITGERDVPFCGGNCLASEPSIPSASKQYFPNTTDFETVIVPGAGHGLNLEYSWPTTYSSILDFFDKNVQS
ncbi:Alpha/Beta hydrolase protein [Whalleya microplaca]|nr:Alpha/Beta hydrolase protein [Whalleya microplaca]